MGTTLAIIGALGGAASFGTAVVFILRAIFKQVSATDHNTAATENLTKAVGELNEKFGHLDTRVTVLEDHDKQRRNGVRAT